MRWTWDPDKAAANRRKHGVSFELAAVALDDPLQLSLPDPHEDADRWRTLACAGPACLFIVHTLPEGEDEEGRIVSARRATSRERRAYEEG
jgi:uncharacterized DUF497 family protein